MEMNAAMRAEAKELTRNWFPWIPTWQPFLQAMREERLEDAIEELVSHTGPIIFPALEEILALFEPQEGNDAIGGYHRGICLWAGMNSRTAVALMHLFQQGRLDTEPCDPFIYIDAECTLDLPILTQQALRRLQEEKAKEGAILLPLPDVWLPCVLVTPADRPSRFVDRLRASRWN